MAGAQKIDITHSWDITPQEAIAIQQELRSKVILQDEFGTIRRVAGVDAGFEEGGSITRAAIAVLSFPDLQIQETASARCATSFPYVPGLLSFREAPAILEAMAQLAHPPDLLLCDGQGYAHPRRFGFACHLGVLCDLPSIGVAKSRLIGEHAAVGEERGAWQPLVDGDEVIGAALRTRVGTRLLYVSTGHRIGLEMAIELVLQCAPRYRQPEPIRQAHHLASRLLRPAKNAGLAMTG